QGSAQANGTRMLTSGSTWYCCLLAMTAVLSGTGESRPVPQPPERVGLRPGRVACLAVGPSTAARVAQGPGAGKGPGGGARPGSDSPSAPARGLSSFPGCQLVRVSVQVNTGA